MKKTHNISDSLKSHAPLAGTIGTVGGFAADVLAPLADFALYIFILGLIASLFLGFKWFKKRKPEILNSISDGKLTQEEANDTFLNDKTSKAFSFSAITTGIMMVIMVGQFFIGDDEKGMFASTIPGLDKLQGQLLNIEEGINEIKQTTQDIRQDTAEIKDSTKEIKNDTSKILTNVTNIADKISDFDDEIEEIKNLAGLIATPKTFPEFAHNAKVLIEQEKFSDANMIYEQMAAFKHDYFDIFSDHEFVLRRLGKSSREVEDYFANYPSKNGIRFGELRLAVELTNDNLNAIYPSFNGPSSKEIILESTLVPIQQFCKKFPNDIIGAIYEIFFARETLNCSDVVFFGYQENRDWGKYVELCEDAMLIENKFRLQFPTLTALKRRYFWKNYAFGGSQIQEMKAVRLNSYESEGFEQKVKQSYRDSTGFENWSMFFTIFGNGEGWSIDGDFGPDNTLEGLEWKPLTWADVDRSSRFKDDYLHELKKASLKVCSVIPDFTYTQLKHNNKSSDLINYNTWAFSSGSERINLINKVAGALLSNKRKEDAKGMKKAIKEASSGGIDPQILLNAINEEFVAEDSVWKILSDEQKETFQLKRAKDPQTDEWKMYLGENGPLFSGWVRYDEGGKINLTQYENGIGVGYINTHANGKKAAEQLIINGKKVTRMYNEQGEITYSDE